MRVHLWLSRRAKIVLGVRGREKRQSGLPEESPDVIASGFEATIYRGVICVIPSRSAGSFEGLETLLDGRMRDVGRIAFRKTRSQEPQFHQSHLRRKS
jgi:hypothetical protein